MRTTSVAAPSGRLSPLPSLRRHDYRQPANNVSQPQQQFMLGGDDDGESIDNSPRTPEYPRATFSPYVPASGRAGGATSGGGCAKLRLRARGRQSRPVKCAANANSRRTKLLHQLKRKAKAVLPRIRDVNIIDKYRSVLNPCPLLSSVPLVLIQSLHRPDHPCRAVISTDFQFLA